MPIMLVFATLFISLALVFYSIGVWAERLSRILKPWHVAVFWAGFVCDTTGTTLMGIIARGGQPNVLHAVSGVSAIVLMLFHAVWASFVIRRGHEKAKRRFHTFSLFVWLVWLVPYLSGMIMAMSR
jgi:uncharacterized repeat protein (TIGR03987 family)